MLILKIFVIEMVKKCWQGCCSINVISSSKIVFHKNMKSFWIFWIVLLICDEHWRWFSRSQVSFMHYHRSIFKLRWTHYTLSNTTKADTQWERWKQRSLFSSPLTPLRFHSRFKLLIICSSKLPLVCLTKIPPTVYCWKWILNQISCLLSS